MYRFKDVRLAKGFSSMKDFAKFLGIPYTTYINYEKGKREPKSEFINDFCDRLGVSIDYMTGRVNEPTAIYEGNRLKNLHAPNITDDVVTFPVLGSIAAGYEEVAIEDWSGGVIDIPKKYLKGRNENDFFVLEVNGNSMYPLYHEKDKVLILKQNYIEKNGDVGAVIYDGECATLKRVDVFDDMVKLSPVNPEYQPKELKGADMETYHILGVPRLLVREIS